MLQRLETLRRSVRGVQLLERGLRKGVFMWDGNRSQGVHPEVRGCYFRNRYRSLDQYDAIERISFRQLVRALPYTAVKAACVAHVVLAMSELCFAQRYANAIVLPDMRRPREYAVFRICQG